MGFKKYIVLSIIFIALVYGYLFSLELGDYRVTFFEISVNLPIAVWVIVPLVLLFVMTVLHILFYGFINIFKQRAINKDYSTMIEKLKSELLGKSHTKKFKTKVFKDLSNILSQFSLNVKDKTFTSADEELNKIVANIQDVEKGQYVSEKSFKVNKTSSLASLNLLNKINEQVDFALDVVKKSENYPQEVSKHAFEKVLDEKSMTTVKKVYKNIKLDKYLAKKLFEKDASNNEFGFSIDEISKIVKELNYDREDYLTLAKIYEGVLEPDQNISLFEELSNESEKATPAYLHVLFEFEMIDKAKEILATSTDEEFKSFKALLDLKDLGKQYKLEELSYK